MSEGITGATQSKNEKPGELEARRACCCYPTLALGVRAGNKTSLSVSCDDRRRATIARQLNL